MILTHMKTFRTPWLGQWILAILLLGSLLPAQAQVFICLCDTSCSETCVVDVVEPTCSDCGCCDELVPTPVPGPHEISGTCDGPCDAPCKKEHVTFHGIAKAVANAAPPTPPAPPAILWLLRAEPSRSIVRTSRLRLLNFNVDPPPPDWQRGLQTSVMRT